MKPERGTYALLLSCATDALLQVGRLGRMRLRPGFYLYVGSAFGPGGVRGRIAHHQKLSQRPHWHLDYARPYLTMEEVWMTYEAASREHEWAGRIQGLPGSSVPLCGFGASDCDCESHFYFFKSRPSRNRFQQMLQACGSPQDSRSRP